MLRYLDAPARLLFWTMGETIILLLAVILPLTLLEDGSAILAMVLGIYGSSRALKLWRQFDIKALCYWYLPSRKGQLRYDIPSHLRLFIG
jgi:phosphotransferase system  glucose/maltose/N-acetylglucosamine-specific IIC component